MPLPKPNKGEQKDQFISRCMGDDVMVSEYDDTSQRYAVCTDCWSKHFSAVVSKVRYEKDANDSFNLFRSVEMLNVRLAGGKVSMDYDDTLSTDRGKQIAKQLIGQGVDLHIITRRQQTDGAAVLNTAKELGIPSSKVHFTNGKLKWETIKRLGITKHYDNNKNELDQIHKNLPNVKTIQFSLEEN